MKNKILIILIILLPIINLNNFVFSQATPPGPSISPLSTEAWKYFYVQFRPFADVACLEGNTALEKITNCAIKITKALQYLAVILFVFSLTYSAGLLVFAPFKKDAIDISKKIIIWSIMVL